MSLVFEALQNLEAERYGVFRPTPPEAMELLKCVERRIVTSPGALPTGPDVDVHAGEPAKLFPVPTPVVASAAVASAAPEVAPPIELVSASPAPVAAVPLSNVAAGATPAGVAAVSAPQASPVQASATPASAIPASAIPASALPSGAPPAWLTPAKPAAKAPVEAAPRQASTKTGRAVAMLTAALPLVQSVLNLVDGNKGAAFAALLAPKAQVKPAALAAAPALDLSAITNGLTALKNQQHELHVQVVEQNSSLTRIENQLEMVREATLRNTLEQKEMIEDLRGVGNRINLVAVLGLGLLAASVAAELMIYLRILKVL